MNFFRQGYKLQCSQMNPTNLTRISTMRADPTRLKPILEPGSGRVQIRFIKHIIGLNPNLNIIWGQLDLFGPVFWPWGPTRPDSTQILGPKLGSARKKTIGFGRTSWIQGDKNIAK